MLEKTLKTRVIQKHDTETNWNGDTKFIPFKGEIIIYDIDDNYNYERFKLGDGITPAIDLPFYLEHEISNLLEKMDDLALEIINDNTDQTYDSTSTKPQSGTAVAQAIGLLEDHLLPVFIGTQAQYNTYQNVIKTGTIVVILDDNAAQDFTEGTLPILGTSALGQMAIG